MREVKRPTIIHPAVGVHREAAMSTSPCGVLLELLNWMTSYPLASVPLTIY